MATIVIKSKNDNLFTKAVGVLIADFTRTYHARETTGEYIRAEMQGTEKSDLFTPIHFSEIEVDGVIGKNANQTVSLLNKVIYNNGGSSTITHTGKTKVSTTETFRATAGQTKFVLSEKASNIDVEIDRVNALEKIDYLFTANDTIITQKPLTQGSILVIRKYFTP